MAQPAFTRATEALGMPSAGPAVLRLADTLDQALAYGEDLLALRQGVLVPQGRQSASEVDDVIEVWRGFIVRLRTKEMALTLRLAQVRSRIDALDGGEWSVKSALKLFLASTAPLTQPNAWSSSGQLPPIHQGHDLLAFLIGRGLIASDAATLHDVGSVQVTDGYLVGGVLPLGMLLDATSRVLDLLDARYGLYPGSADACALVGAPAAPDPLNDRQPLPALARAEKEEQTAFSASDAALDAALALATVGASFERSVGA